jgi:hypothetical protein
MNGKAIGIFLVVLGLIAGAAMYWLQVYAYYDEVRLASDGGNVVVRATKADGTVQDLQVSEFHGIDSESSPIRFRACFLTSATQNGLALWPQGDAARRAGLVRLLRRRRHRRRPRGGARVAVLGQQNIVYGIDRVLALYPDGRAFAWHQINACGEVVFDGDPPPEGCPPVPERLN